MKILLLLAVVFTASSVMASDACEQVTTTIEINQCAESVYQAADAKLNTAYQAALKRIDSDVDNEEQLAKTRASLIEAQRLWLLFRDEDCSAVYHLWSDGTIRGAMYRGCMTGHSNQRTKELDSFSFAESLR